MANETQTKYKEIINKICLVMMMMYALSPYILLYLLYEMGMKPLLLLSILTYILGGTLSTIYIITMR